MSNDKVLHVVLADDDPDDRMIFEKAFSETVGSSASLTMARDGEELMDMLLAPEAVAPDVLFLDLNMPCKNGFECLDEIRALAQFNKIFIVVCSTSGSQHEMDVTFNKGATLFMRKLNSFGDLKTAISKIIATDHRDYLANARKERFVLKL